MQAGKSPIYESNLSELMKRNISKKRLFFTTSIEQGMQEAEVVFIAVGTPMKKDGDADLTFILEVARDIGKNLRDYKVIVNKSTVPVGTVEKVENEIRNFCSCKFDVVSNPEFLREGSAVEDFFYPERVIIGTDNSGVFKIMENLYRPFLLNENPILHMSIRAAELTKYACNSFLATKISFVNEIANLADKLGVNYEEVRRGMSLDSRIGNQFLYAGIGYGGSCFPKDVRALLNIAQKSKSPLKILEKVEEVNSSQKLKLIDKMSTHYQSTDFIHKTFGIWGLSFKSNSDDMREAPSIELIDFLYSKGSKIKVFDPVAHETSKFYFEGKVIYCNDLYEAAEATDAILLLTEWREFRRPDFQKIKDSMKVPLIFDGRNQYKRDLIESQGFQYYCIGC